MKKIFSLLLIVSCFMLTACGGPPEPTAKEEAVKLNDNYIKQAYNIVVAMNDDMKKFWKENGDDWSTDVALGKLIKEKYVPQIDTLVKKFESEKVANKSVKSLITKELKAEQDRIHIYASLEDTAGMSKAQYDEKSKEFKSSIAQILNTELEFNNEYSILVNNKSAYELTLANFRKIHKDDEYFKVANTFQMPGKLENSMETNHKFIGQRLLEVYTWENDGGFVKIMFENGKAYQMEQRNLK